MSAHPSPMTKYSWRLTGMKVTGGVSTVDDELHCAVEVHSSVLPYLN